MRAQRNLSHETFIEEFLLLVTDQKAQANETFYRSYLLQNSYIIVARIKTHELS